MAVRSEDLALGGRGAVVYRFPRVAAARRRARRRMIVRRRLTLAFAGLVIVAATLAGGGVAETAPGGRGPDGRGPRAVVVQPGDTLWGVAAEHAPPGSDVRAYVDALIELNGLDGPLQAGARLRLVRPR